MVLTVVLFVCDDPVGYAQVFPPILHQFLILPFGEGTLHALLFLTDAELRVYQIILPLGLRGHLRDLLPLPSSTEQTSTDYALGLRRDFEFSGEGDGGEYREGRDVLLLGGGLTEGGVAVC